MYGFPIEPRFFGRFSIFYYLKIGTLNPNGIYSMQSWHSDDERDMVPEGEIASVSFGMRDRHACDRSLVLKKAGDFGGALRTYISAL